MPLANPSTIYTSFTDPVILVCEENKAVSILVATAVATAGSPHHRAFKYRTFLATPLTTVIAVAVAINLDTA